MQVLELDGQPSPEETHAAVARHPNAKRVAPSPGELEQGESTALQLMQPPAGFTAANADQLQTRSSKSVAQAWVDIRHDATELPRAVRQKVLFQHMCPDTVSVHGLHDWAVDEWVHALETQPQPSAVFLAQFLGAGAISVLGPGGMTGADTPQQLALMQPQQRVAAPRPARNGGPPWLATAPHPAGPTCELP